MKQQRSAFFALGSVVLATVVTVFYSLGVTRRGDPLVFLFGESIGAAGFFVLVLLTVFAYWRVSRLSEEAAATFSLRTILIVALALGLLFSIIPPLASQDIYYSLSFGEAVDSGANPYLTTVAAMPQSPLTALVPLFRHLPMPYGPLWAWVTGASVHFFGTSPAVNVLAMRVLLIAAFLGSIALLYSILSNQVRWRTKAVILLAWNPLLLLFGINEARGEVLILFLLMLAVWAYQRRSMALVPVLLAIATLFKWVPAILFPLFFLAVWRGRVTKKERNASILGGAVAALLLMVVLWAYWGDGALARALIGQTAYANFTIVRSQLAMLFTPAIELIQRSSPGNIVFSSSAITTSLWVSLAGFVVLYLWACWSVWKRRIDFFGASFLCLLFTLLFALTWVVPWYCIWVYPFALMTPATGRFFAMLTLLVLGTLFQSMVGALPILLFVGAVVSFRSIFTQPKKGLSYETSV